MQLIPTIKSIIIFQIILIIILNYQLHNKKNILGAKTSISPLDKSTIQQNETDGLKYFYDFLPNQIATYSATFLKNPITVTFNNDGLNDVNNYSVNKDPSVFRIITLGDSYTFGHFVNTKDNWTEVLENKLNEKQICKNISKFEVINLGAPGFDPTYEAARYKKTGQKYNPDLIIWMLMEIERVNEKKIPLENDCYKNQKDHQISPDINCWTYAVDRIRKENGSGFFINQQKLAISNLKKIYTKHIFFIDFYDKHQEVLKDISDSTTFSKLATKKYLYSQHSPSEVHFPDAHPNELGHEIISDIIFNKLFETNQVPCEPLIENQYTFFEQK